MRKNSVSVSLGSLDDDNILRKTDYKTIQHNPENSQPLFARPEVFK